VVLGGCPMAHMDDEVAKHIKEMILRVVRKPSENQGQPIRLGTLNQVVRMLRRGPDYPMNFDQPSMQRLVQRDGE
jgi:hypothetical protein